MLQFILNIIIKIWDILIFYPVINLLYLILAFNNNLGIATIILVIIIRTLLLPTTYHQLWVAKMNIKLQKHLQNIKKRKERKQKQKELYKKHKFNPLSAFGVMILSIPIMIALYQAIPLAQTGAQTLRPYIWPITTWIINLLHANIQIITTTLWNINLSTNPTKITLWILALTTAIQNILTINYNNPQTYDDMLKLVKKQFNTKGAKENDYKLMAKTMYYGKYINVVIGAYFMFIIFKNLPAIFTIYILAMNIYNILTMPILNYFIEKKLPEIK